MSILKRSIALLLAFILLISGCFAACASKDGESKEVENLSDAEEVVGFETVEATDENGKTVTDSEGNTVTTQVAVVYEKKGKKTVAYVIDNSGKKVTNKNGKNVTVKTDVDLNETTKASKKTTTTKNQTIKTTKTTKKTTSTTAKKGDQTTKKELTTNPKDLSVPKTSATGPSVTFSSADQQKVKNILEVPYLFKANYESSQGVPINIATHAAIWMAQNEGLTMSTYASGTVVIDLFKYFAQTVVDFKTLCNSKGDCENITYNASGDNFTIKAFEDKVQTVSIKEIQDLGGNNYYKVIGNVSGAGGIKKVTAVIQKNKLDSSLGFSVKALKWE